MKFNMPLTDVQLSELNEKLLPLVTSVTYQGGTLNIEPVQKNDQEANEKTANRITDLVIPYLPITQDLPDWGALTRAHGKPQRAGAR